MGACLFRILSPLRCHINSDSCTFTLWKEPLKFQNQASPRLSDVCENSSVLHRYWVSKQAIPTLAIPNLKDRFAAAKVVERGLQAYNFIKDQSGCSFDEACKQ
jgi:hypothetical protein